MGKTEEETTVIDLTTPEGEKNEKKTRRKMSESAKKGFGEFKKFAFRGNIIDLAIAFIIGLAFQKIVTSFVNDIIMPLIAALIGDVKFTDLVWKINGDVTLNYGAFIQTIFEFFVIALSIFIMFKVYKKISNLRKKDETPPTPPGPTKTEELLGDIKKLLEKQTKS